MEKQAKTGGDPEAKRMLKILLMYREALNEGKSARTVEIDEIDQKLAKDFQLLTNKPILYVCNVDEASVLTGNKYVDAVKEAIKDENAEMLIIAAATESRYC